MSEKNLVQNCAPTLAGIKTGNLFTGKFNSKEELQETVCFWNRKLSKKGVRMLPLRFNNGVALLYVYRSSHLSRDLEHQTAVRLLKERGYNNCSPEQCIVRLVERLKENEEFPHEIGLFLGYPPEDVDGFIENKAQNSKCVGCWKVYGDEKAAKNTFEQYKKCTAIYQEQLEKGVTVEQLTIVA